MSVIHKPALRLFILAVSALSLARLEAQVQIRGHLHPSALTGIDRGRLAPGTRLGVVTVFFKKTARQQAELDRLLERQQDSSSPDYHRWLTPEQYGDRFGANPDDAAAMASWLRSQGLGVEAVARSRTWVAFTGTAGQVGKALNTEFHRYQADGEMHFAPAVEPSLPEALAARVEGFDGLDDFQKKNPRLIPQDNLTNGAHAMGAGDFAAIYNIGPLYSAGIDGSGQSIVIAGRTALSKADLADVQTFRDHFGLPSNSPQTVLFGPDPGTSSGDVGEAVLDLTWSGAVARRATIIYVYATSINSAVAYAIDQDLAKIISYSYGGCEQKQTGAGPFVLRAIAQQANAQGATWLVASGDSGPAECEAHQVNPMSTKGLAASFPATIPEVTAVGGTEFEELNGTYWRATNDSTFSSAMSYIPERAWNDTAILGGIAASGGGRSILYSKPAWQTGQGVPSDNARDTPDISMAGSWAHDGYIVYSGGGLFLSGGTSASTPSFAGVLALLNQSLIAKGVQSQPGLGNINPALYRYAQTTPSAFHDITVGDIMVPCVVNGPDCASGSQGFATTAAYDLATGLGSIDVFNFVSKWDTSAAVTSATLATDSATVPITDTFTLTATVLAASASAVPTGTVFFNLGTTLLGAARLNGFSARNSASLKIYASQLPAGPNMITAAYTGDSGVNGSAATVAVTVTVPTANSAVVPSVSPSPVYQDLPDSSGFTYFFQLKLTEVAGVATTLTSFTIDGVTQQISTFFSTTAIRAKGTLTANIGSRLASASGTRTFGFTGLDLSGFEWSQQITVQFLPFPDYTIVGGISNAASGKSVYAPGMIMSVYGVFLAPSTKAAAALPLPTTLNGVTATVNGVPVPFYFVSTGQVNVQIPYETPIGGAVLEINNNGYKYSFSFTVAAAAPGIFTDANLNTVPFASGARGQTLLLYITGDGKLSPALGTGASPPTSTPISQLPAPVLPVSLTVGNVRATITFVGVPYFVAGATQINFVVPDTAPLGLQPVVVTVGNVASAAAALRVTQ